MRSVGVRAHPLVFGVVVFLASESMLFAGLLAAWYDLRGQSSVWVPAGAQLDVAGATFGTALLGLGSITMGVAQWSASNRKRGVARGMLVATIFCALAFTYIALRSWSLANFSVDTNAFGTLFFVLTGVHLAHVIVGAILLTMLDDLSPAPRIYGRQSRGRRGDRVLLAFRVYRLGRFMGNDLSHKVTLSRSWPPRSPPPARRSRRGPRLARGDRLARRHGVLRDRAGHGRDRARPEGRRRFARAARTARALASRAACRAT
jgi:hypothetical protein